MGFKSVFLFLIPLILMGAMCDDDSLILAHESGQLKIKGKYYGNKDGMFEITAILSPKGVLQMTIISRSTRGKTASFKVDEEIAEIIKNFTPDTRVVDMQKVPGRFFDHVKSVEVVLGGIRQLDDQGHVFAKDPELDKLNQGMNDRWKSDHTQGRLRVGAPVDKADILYHGVLNTSFGQIIRAGLLGPGDIEASMPPKEGDDYKEVTLRFKPLRK